MKKSDNDFSITMKMQDSQIVNLSDQYMCYSTYILGNY